MKKCPFCAEEIKEEARICKHCGKDLNESSSEEVVFEQHPNMFKNNPVLFLVCVALTPVLVGIIALTWWWVSCRANTFTITNKRTIHRTGIFSKNTNEILHNHIRNIMVRQGIFDRMFRVGTLAISSAGQSDVEIVFTGIDSPQSIKETIDKYRIQ